MYKIIEQLKEVNGKKQIIYTVLDKNNERVVSTTTKAQAQKIIDQLEEL